MFVMWGILCFLSLLCVASGYAEAGLLRQVSPLDLSRWSRGHEADANQKIRVTIALAIQDSTAGVETLLRISDPTSSDYGQHLSAAQVARMFKPKPDAISDVLRWLGESHIDRNSINISHSGDRLFLSLSVHEATLLLKTSFHSRAYHETGEEMITCQDYYIPEQLVGSIDYVVSISPAPTHRHLPRQQVLLKDNAITSAPLPPGCLNQTTLSCLRKIYKIPENAPPHPDNSFGIFEPSWYSWLPEDLDEFFGKMQSDLVGNRPKVAAINGGYFQRKRRNESFWYDEASLDFEYAMALTSPQEVTNFQVGSYEQRGNLHDMLAAFDGFFCGHADPGNEKFPDIYPPGCNSSACDCNSAPPPKVLSISWGWAEANFTPSYLQRECLEFLKLGLMGTTVVVGAGDNGAGCRGNSSRDDDGKRCPSCGRFGPTYPASCPWVTTVGGTQMLRSINPRIPAEEAVFRQANKLYTLSSGGGFSDVFLAPPYQAPNVASYKDIEGDHLAELRDHFNGTGRGYPDVAALANYYPIVSNGRWKLGSGTSASSPVFASIIALINGERMHAGKGAVGFINPVLYGNPGVLNDIVTGSNQGCGVDEAFRAARGWDAVTGLGSPDYERMRELFLDLP